MDKRYFSKLITQAETLTMKWLKPVPHLPKTVAVWIADNVWWVAIVTMILMILSAFVSLIGVFGYISFLGNESSAVGIYNVPVYSSMWLLYTLVSLAFSSLVAYLYYKAITPLKAKLAAGWRLLFVIFLIGVVRAVLFSFVDLNVFMVVFSLLFAAIAYVVTAYLLFEIRHYFVKSSR